MFVGGLAGGRLEVEKVGSVGGGLEADGFRTYSVQGRRAVNNPLVPFEVWMIRSPAHIFEFEKIKPIPPVHPARISLAFLPKAVF